MLYIRLVRWTMPWTMKQQRACSLHIRLVWWTMPWWIKKWRLLTLYSFGTCIGHHQQYRWRIACLAGQTVCRILKVAIALYTWSPFIMKLKFYYTLHKCSSWCTLHRHSAASGLPHDAINVCLFYYQTRDCYVSLACALWLPGLLYLPTNL